MSLHELWLAVGADHPCDLSGVTAITGVAARSWGSKGDLVTKPDGGLRPRLRSSWVYRTPSEDGLTLIKGLEPLRELFEPTASKLRAHVVGLGATISVGVDLKVAVDDAWAAISVVLSPPDLRFLDSLHANFVVNALMPGHIDRVE